MAVALILLSLSAGVVYPLVRPETTGRLPSPNAPLPFSDRWVPTQGDMREIARLEQKFAALARLAESEPDSTRLTLFTGPAGKKREPAPPRSIKRASYAITLAFVSGGRRYCMVNKKLYTTGETLPGGEAILEIESRRIRIEREGRPMWITMAPHPDSVVAAAGQERRM